MAGKARLSVVGDQLLIKIPYESRDVAKSIGARWDKSRRAWALPADPGFEAAAVEALRKASINLEGYKYPLCQQKASEIPSVAQEGHFEVPDTRYEPWEHQRNAFHFVAPKPGAMLNLAPGTGKTKIAVDLMIARKTKVNLVLCPLAVIRDVWDTQVVEHAGGHKVKVLALDSGSVLQKAKKAREFIDLSSQLGFIAVVVINYESAWRKDFARFAESVGWDMLILDESHRVKSPKGKTSMFVRRLARKASWRLALTGTPAPHSPLDLWSQIDAVAPGVLPASFHAFRARYAVLGGFEGKQVVAFRDLGDLSEKVGRVTFKAGNEVLDLPDAIHQRRSFELPKKAKAAYDSLERDLYAYLDSGEVSVRNALEKVLRLQQFTGGWVKYDGEDELQRLHTAKEDALVEVLSDLPADEPVVVFSRFWSDLDSTHSAVERVGRSSFEISGRRRGLADWKAAEGGEVLAAQIQAGGVGVDLTRSRYVVYFSVGYSLGDYLQSLARVHRPGQGRSVVYYHLVGRGTIDEKVYAALLKRQNVVEKVIGELGAGYDTGLDPDIDT